MVTLLLSGFPGGAAGEGGGACQGHQGRGQLQTPGSGTNM